MTTEADVTQEVNEEVAGATAPIEAEITDTAADEAAALASVSEMFSGLMPYVQASATEIAESEQFAAGVQQSIFNTASLQLNQMAQARAAEAQALAQQMGGPVDMTEFGKALAPTMATMPETFAGAQLHALAQGQVSVQQAEAWAGKVFPMYQVEQTTQLTKYFEDKKSELRKQIAALEAEKPGLINARLNERLQQEREYELEQANLALEKLKVQHDWYATKEQLKQQRKEFELAKKQLGLDVAGVTGEYKGESTLAAKGQQAEINAQIKAGRLADKEALVKEKQTAMELAEKITQSGDPQTYTTSVAVVVDKPLAGTKGVYKKKVNGKWVYYTYEDVKQTTQAGARTNDPNEIYNYLLAAGISKSVALSTVRAQIGNQKWGPGQNAATKTTTTKLTKSVLAGKSVSQLQSIAKRMGFKGSTKNRSTLTNWILSKIKGGGSSAKVSVGGEGKKKKEKKKKGKKKKPGQW
jgi:hypothetical protein